MSDKVSVTCWCERTTLMIPVAWLSEAKTGSCGSDCGPGCPSRATQTDSFDDYTGFVTTGKRPKMSNFDPAKYDSRPDSSFGYGGTTTRREHPDALILEVHEERGSLTLCMCGCTEPPQSKRATFRMGHDVRLKGKLARAQAAGVQVVLTNDDHSVREVLDVLEFASRFNTDKLDWAKATIASVEKITGRQQADPKVGDVTEIKIGRWLKSAKIIGINCGSPVYEYTDASGKVHHAEEINGKIRDVAS